MTNATQAPIPVRFACGLYDRMLPLYTGDVKPRGIDLQFHAIDDPRVIFDRMAADQAFYACEMSSSEFISRLCSPNAAVDCPFVALPVFPSRVFGMVISASMNTAAYAAPKIWPASASACRSTP